MMGKNTPFESHLDEIPFSFPELAGIEGAIGAEPAAFRVEEIPAYEPCGSGEHVMMLIEKRGISTVEAIRRLAVELGQSPSWFGCAGFKDTNSVSRQHLSIAGVEPEVITDLRIEDVQIIWAQRHHNKLRTGHLKGNRFVIRIDSFQPDDLDKAQKTMRALMLSGMANLYGPQRFGAGDQNVSEGFDMVRGIGRSVNKHRRRFLLSAVQARLFNAYLAARMESRTERRVLMGDILRIGKSYFVTTEPETEQRRLDAREIQITGPIFGSRAVIPPEGSIPLQLEEECLKTLGLSREVFEPMKKIAPGGRRDLVVFPEEGEVSKELTGSLLIRFVLPSGSYATVLVRELLRRPFAQLRLRSSSRQSS